MLRAYGYGVWRQPTGLGHDCVVVAPSLIPHKPGDRVKSVAVTLVAEVGDLTRFTNPRRLMAYLGLAPSEQSSGQSVRRGGITKAGNGAARRVLIEAAWAYGLKARISRIRLRRWAMARQVKP